MPKIGVGATRIQVRSLPYGWLWFIPLGPKRTSIGLVIPAEHFKRLGKRPAEVYLQALEDEQAIAELLKNATCEDQLGTTRDWSFLAERHAGENWFLVGECAGFADPILSAGVSMAQIGAQQAAYTILELDRNTVESKWLKNQFSIRQKRRISTHISFADYWYVANAQFSDLKVFTAELAKTNGLDLSPDMAWRWLAQGGFIDEDLTVGAGGFNLLSIRSSTDFLTDLATDSPLEENNVLKLDLKGATLQDGASYAEGRVNKSPCYVRNGKTLPLRGHFGILVQLLQREASLPRIVEAMDHMAKARAADPVAMTFLSMLPEAMEGMIRDGWIIPSYDPKLPRAKLLTSGAGFHLNRDTRTGA